MVNVNGALWSDDAVYFMSGDKSLDG